MTRPIAVIAFQNLGVTNFFSLGIINVRATTVQDMQEHSDRRNASESTATKQTSNALSMLSSTE